MTIVDAILCGISGVSAAVVVYRLVRRPDSVWAGYDRERKRIEADPDPDDEWTRVVLRREVDVSEVPAITRWLDGRCFVKPGNETAPYKKSEDWFAEKEGNFRVWRIKDPLIAEDFRVRWG